MLAEVLGPDLFLVLLFLVSLGLVVWAIVDAAKQPALSSGARAGWIISLVVGTFLFGVVGLVIALVYLVGVRPRLMRSN
jgi:energy-converting hydrogenase Eha subunit H